MNDPTDVETAVGNYWKDVDSSVFTIGEDDNVWIEQIALRHLQSFLP